MTRVFFLLKMLVLVAGLWLVSVVASAQQETIHELISEIEDGDPWAAPIERLIEQGDTRGAGIRARTVVFFLQRDGRNLEAVDALLWSSELFGREDLDWVTTRLRLAEAYELADMELEAENELTELLQQTHGESDYGRATRRGLLFELGSFYRRQGEGDKAEENFQQAVALVTSVEEAGTYIEASLRELKEIYRSQERYDEAAEMARRLLTLLEPKLKDGLKDARIIAELLDEYAVFSDHAGRFRAAEEARERALMFRAK